MVGRAVYAAAVGLVLYAATLFVWQNSEGPAIVLYFASGVVVGIVAASLKWGFALAFVMTFAFQAIINGVALLDPNVFLAFVAIAAISSTIAGVLGAAGGLAGRRLFGKKAVPPVSGTGAASGAGT